MSNAPIKKELAATVLIEALYVPDSVACERYGISVRTLGNYRRYLATDAELAELFRLKKGIFDRAWAEEMPTMLRKGSTLLSDCFDAIKTDTEKKKDPQVIAAIAGAMKLTADIYLTGKVIDARLADADRPADGIPHETPAEENKEYLQ